MANVELSSLAQLPSLNKLRKVSWHEAWEYHDFDAEGYYAHFFPQEMMILPFN